MTLSSPPAGPMLAHLADNVPRQCCSHSLRAAVFFPGCKIQSSWCAQHAVANAPRGLVQNVSVLLIYLCLIAELYAALVILVSKLALRA